MNGYLLGVELSAEKGVLGLCGGDLPVQPFFVIKETKKLYLKIF